MAAREVEELRRLLSGVGDSSERLMRRLEALHSVAFDRRVSDEVKVHASREGWALSDVGVQEAKDAWRVLSAAAQRAAVAFQAAGVVADRLLSAGGAADLALRGSLLGDDVGASASTELARLLESQRRRLARGEFDPGRAEPQPGVGRR